MEEHWYAVHTQVRGEDKARPHLERQGFAVYLPRYAKRRRHARRVDWVARPLFPRYLFVAMDVESTRWRAINSTVGVCGIVTQGERPAEVPAQVINEIRARENSAGLIEIKPSLRKGQTVRICDGPLNERVGFVDRVDDDDERVVLLLGLLGREVRVRLPTKLVSPLH